MHVAYTRCCQFLEPEIQLASFKSHKLTQLDFAPFSGFVPVLDFPFPHCYSASVKAPRLADQPASVAHHSQSPPREIWSSLFEVILRGSAEGCDDAGKGGKAGRRGMFGGTV